MGNPTGISLVDLGLRMPEMIAGFMGGVMSALAMTKPTVLQIVSSIFAGIVTANYLTGPATDYLSFPAKYQLGAAFISGLAGMAVCRGVIGAAAVIAAKWQRSKEDAPGK